MQLRAVYVTLLVSFLGATYGYDCANSLTSDVRQCFVNEGLYFNLTVDDELQLAKFVGSVTQCRKIGLYKNASECAMQYMRNCLRVSKLEGALPETTKMHQGMDFLCENYPDFDSQCLNNRRDDIEQCGKDLIKGVVEKYRNANMQLSVTEIICISIDLAYDCAALHLTSCSTSTKAIYLELLDKYYVPSACQDRPPGRSRSSYVGSSTVSPTTGSFLGTTYGYDCANSLSSDVRQCFANEGFDLNQTGDADELLRRAQIIDSETGCQKIDLYKNAWECALQFVRKCVRVSGMEGVLPNTTKMFQGMDFLCENYPDFDFQCENNRLDDIMQCGKDLMKGVAKKYRNANMQLSVTEIICISTDLAYDCSALQLTSCPKYTKAIYLELLDKYYVPSACQDRPPGRSRSSYVGSSTVSPTTVDQYQAGRTMMYYEDSGTASLTTFFNPFLAVLVSMATLIFLRWSG